ncbi:MAG: hypothetical protein K5675_00095 [Lachnospiraceae bacterium]|nr:hypothetical protein [Lachnospiraceae bacterium]
MNLFAYEFSFQIMDENKKEVMNVKDMDSIHEIKEWLDENLDDIELTDGTIRIWMNESGEEPKLFYDLTLDWIQDEEVEVIAATFALLYCQTTLGLGDLFVKTINA